QYDLTRQLLVGAFFLDFGIEAGADALFKRFCISRSRAWRALIESLGRAFERFGLANGQPAGRRVAVGARAGAQQKRKR
ncbi:MAG: hypothetical protein ABL897_07050, partial [Hyphomicrobium sp.]